VVGYLYFIYVFIYFHTNVPDDFHARQCIPWDTNSTLDETQAALHFMQAQVQAQWMVLLEQDSYWVQSMSQKKDISCPWCTNGHESSTLNYTNDTCGLAQN
jgi:hypothetical protein